MKRYICLLLVLAMLITAGCQKNDTAKESESEIKTGVVDFDGIPLYSSLASSTHLVYDNVEDYIENFNLEQYIIFKGIKRNDSTQFLSIQDGNILYDWRSETPIEVIEAYYGDVKAGDEIIFDEFAAVIEVGGESFVVCDESTPPIRKNTEYIFFLAHTGQFSSENEPMYSYVDMYHSINELTDEVKTADSANELSKGDFSKDVFNKYHYNTPDTKLDIEKEVQKLLKNDSEAEGYTENHEKLKNNEIGINEAIEKLDSNDKALIKKMISQYGTVD